MSPVVSRPLADGLIVFWVYAGCDTCADYQNLYSITADLNENWDILCNLTEVPSTLIGFDKSNVEC